MSVDVEQGKRLIVRMFLAEAAFLLPAMGFAFGHFGRHIGWMLWAFVGCLAGAFSVQLWFISRIARMKNGA